MAIDFKAKQHEFTQYIRNPLVNPPPADVKPERMVMYRELIFNNLDGFLASNFPVVRNILADARWYELIQDFLVKHQAKTPYFAEIAEEFLAFLEHERRNPDDFPFLLELAHYEWVEMALSIAQDNANSSLQPYDNLLAQKIKLSPLAWPLIYRFPVQLISPDYLPEEPPAEPTCLIVYRDQTEEIKFSVINPITYRLLEILQAEDSVKVDQCFVQLCQESTHINQNLIMTGGLKILEELIEKSIVLVVL